MVHSTLALYDAFSDHIYSTYSIVASTVLLRVCMYVCVCVCVPCDTDYIKLVNLFHCCTVKVSLIQLCNAPISGTAHVLAN